MNENTQQAENFLKETNTIFEVEFLRLGKHFADDTQKRNIFLCTFENERGSFYIEFGTSIVDTYEETKTSVWDNLQDDDEIDFFTGFKLAKTEISTYVKRKISKKDIRLKSSYLVEVLTIELQAKFITSLNKHIESLKPRSEREIEILKESFKRYDRQYFLNYTRKALAKKEEQLQKEIVQRYDTPKQDIKKPSAHDVLACLTKYDVGTFEDFCDDYGYNSDSRKHYKIYESVLEEFEKVSTIWTAEEIEMLQEIN